MSAGGMRSPSETFFWNGPVNVGHTTTQKLITSLRAFLRFLNFRGECRDDLTIAIPAVAHWRLARLPRCLSAEEVDRLIAASNGTTPGRLRDRAAIRNFTSLYFVQLRIAARSRSLGRCAGCGDQPVYLLRRHTTRQPRQPPVRHGGYCDGRDRRDILHGS